ncbi:MAG TPA: hypothetical protein PKD46_10425 [Aggregatilineaceae bacterium]|jgi:hypothetical protein|nr:hypothetical protein [Anaerolineae bacterium]HMM28688.1 hypothetical protein [Aggregatilineaceae bacterium]
MTSPLRQQAVNAEFLTRSYRISGEVSVRSDPLLDQLNDHLALFVHVERVFVSPLLDPATLTGNFRSVEVRKDTLGLVVLKRAEDGLPHRQGRYIGRDHIERPVVTVAAGFEVRGVMSLHPSVNVAELIRTTPEQFVLIFDASATLTARREVVFNGGAILLNRSQIEVFAALDE